MNKQNQILADYVYLAEASYTDFSQSGDAYENLKDENNGNKPEFFAKLVTQNYEVVAHYKDRVGDGETSFSATLFKGQPNTANADKYVLAMKGSWEKEADLWYADINDIVFDGLAHHQIVDMYNFWQQITHTGEYATKKLVVVEDLTQRLTELQTEFLKAKNELNELLSKPHISANPDSEVLKLNQMMKEYDEKIQSLYQEAHNKGYIIDNERTLTKDFALANKILKIENSTSSQDYAVDDERQQGLGINPNNVVVTGHSLGGHLTAAFSYLFPEIVEHAYMVNGAGFGRDTSIIPKRLGIDAVKNIENVFNGLNPNNQLFDDNKITSIIGDKAPNVTANDWVIGLKQPEHRVDLFIESANLSTTFGHGSEQMSDSMMVASLFFAMDSSLNTQDIQAALNTLNPIFQAAHSDDA